MERTKLMQMLGITVPNVRSVRAEAVSWYGCGTVLDTWQKEDNIPKKGIEI